MEFLLPCNEKSEELSFKKTPETQHQFLRYNTALPSSVSVERLFSVAGSIFKPTRSRLKDRNASFPQSQWVLKI
jgi:hypothetical protein